MIILEKKNLTNYPIPCQPLAILPALKKPSLSLKISSYQLTHSLFFYSSCPVLFIQIKKRIVHIQ